ncbi:MAG: kelch repeat-containing protein [Thalassotalea sp.]|nr:kelch repeat-containing protein [Thalassotalea sp.]
MKILRNYPLATLAALFLATNNVAANPLNIELPALPEPISNNAVATFNHNGQQFLLSFNGLLAGRDYTDVSNKAFMLQLGNNSDKQLGENKWQTIDNVPIAQPVNGLTGRLASIATSIGSKAYVFGDYTVAKDHSEVSVPDVYSFDINAQSYQLLPPMPVPVDDSVALTYQTDISTW